MNAETAYIFRHALLRDAAYQLQLPGDRARLHALALAILEGLCGGRPPEPPPLGVAEPAANQTHRSDSIAFELSEHARAAQDSGGSTAAASLRAVRKLYLRRAAEHAARHFQNLTSSRLWQQHGELVGGSEKGESLLRAAVLASQAGRLRSAEPLADQALALVREAGDARAEGRALGTFAVLYRESGRIGEAEAIFKRALALHRRTGDRRAEAVALGNLAGHFQKSGRVEPAERAYVEALAISRETADRRLEGMTLGNLAILCKETGRAARAERYYEEALSMHREAKDRRLEGIVLGNLAVLYQETGRAGKAEASYGQALAIHREVGNLRSEGVELGNLASLHMDTGRWAEAERGFAQALAINREVENRLYEGVLLGYLGNLHCRSGRFEESREAFERALAIHAEVGNRRFEGGHQCDYALLLLALGRRAQAGEIWRKGAEVLRDLRDSAELGRKTTLMVEACGKAGVTPFDGPHAEPPGPSGIMAPREP